MNLLKITVKRTNEVLGEKIRTAETFWQRFRGLMMQSELEEGEGLLISPCNSIHMMFMKFPIDAIFLDATNRIKALYSKLKPWTGLSSIHRNAVKVLELKAGSIEKAGLEIDDILVMEQITC
ncbi:MAG: DUF192 domain-containing protein [Candidatus Rifleibacteriota bacterium]